MMNLFHNQSISNEYKSLCKVASVVYSEFTTNTDANRKRYSSGIFYLKFTISNNGTALLQAWSILSNW